LTRIALGARSRLAGAALASVLTIAWSAAADKTYYHDQHYDGSGIQAAWHEARSSGHPPAISRIAFRQDQSGKVMLSGNGNDLLTLGYSHLYCYQSVFG